MEELLTIDEVAEILRLKLLTVYRWVECGKIRGVKIGKGWRFKKSEIERFLKEQESQGQYEYAVKLQKQGKIDKAISALKEAIKIYPENKESYFLLGELYLEKAKKEREYLRLAEKAFRQVQEIDPDNIEAVSKLKLITSLYEREEKDIIIEPENDIINRIRMLTPMLTKSFTAPVDSKIFEEAYTTADSLSRFIEERDAYLYGHSEKKAIYVAIIAYELGLSRIQARAFQIATFIYDIGKLYISEKILKKPGKLTEKEIKIIRSHPVIGEQVLRDMGCPNEILECVRHHHESLDGKGYPDGKKGDEIPVGARILKVIDAFGAMVALRPYREPLSFEEALKELEQNSGKEFDPRVVNTFRKIIMEEKDLPKRVFFKGNKTLYKKILIVEDDPWIAKAVKGALEMEGFDVVTSSTGEVALQKIYEVNPNLIVMNGLLPDMNGYELCRRLSQDERSAHIPVIMVSSGEDDKIFSLECGADDYLSKPFNIRELIARINALVRRIEYGKNINPLTGFPGALAIEAEIIKHINEYEDKFGVLYIDLDNLKIFNDTYGFLHGDEVIKLVGEILREGVKKLGDERGFIGHIGGDDFVVIISADKAEAMCKYIISEFDTRILSYYHKEDVERGYILSGGKKYPLMSISIGCVTNQHREFHTYQELDNILREVIGYAKRMGGSAYHIDMRAG